METEPLVTVIIPTYNYAQFINHAIESVLTQTYPNIEIIVVDDGSTDNTSEILDKYRLRIRVISQKNMGAAAARNRGVHVALGEYIAFLDADDVYRSCNIAEKVIFLEKNQEYRWCYSNWAWVDADGIPYTLGSKQSVSLAHIKAQGNVLLLALQGYRLGTNVFLFRREILKMVDGFDENLEVLEDYDLYVRAAAQSPIGYVDQVLCDIFRHQDSLGTGSSKRTAYYCRWLVHRKIVRNYMEQLRLPQVAPAWRHQQADLYRNLAVLACERQQYRRAMVWIHESMHFCLWQPGIFLLWFKMKWRCLQNT